jgi:hypothetical protein
MFRRGEQRQVAAFMQSPQVPHRLRALRFVELRLVAGPELLEAIGIVGVPCAQRG